jgi:SAM-dependent methyltransferase
MSSDIFCCPLCRTTLSATLASFHCISCRRDFDIVEGVPDFFIPEIGGNTAEDPDLIWLDREIVEARDTVYRLCARRLKGMTFCMQEIGHRTSPGCCVLEVGMGTGHFTRWLAEVCEPGTEIYAFDCSWPMFKKARNNTNRLGGITFFRANARGPLPFAEAFFDVVLVRLASLGPRGVPKVRAAFELLRPGGWYFQAGWEQRQYETPPTEWAIQHGYERAEHHVWQYRRLVTEEEHLAMQKEQARLASIDGSRYPGNPEAEPGTGENGHIWRMTQESLLIARKPG